MIDTWTHDLCMLAESPCWDAQKHCWYWIDIPRGNIWKGEPQSRTGKLLFQCPWPLGSLNILPDGNLLLGSDCGIHIFNPNSLLLTLHTKLTLNPGARCNDAILDQHGRLYIGLLEANCVNGYVLRCDPDNSIHRIISNIGITNGMGFSPDQQFFYHTDSLPRTITRYNYHAASGAISDPQSFIQFPEDEGCPDGMHVDTDGQLWIACWGGSCVYTYSAKGQRLHKISVPAKQVSCCALGGPSGNELLITTASHNGPDLTTGRDTDGSFLGGFIYSFSPK